MLLEASNPEYRRAVVYQNGEPIGYVISYDTETKEAKIATPVAFLDEHPIPATGEPEVVTLENSWAELDGQRL